MGAYRNFRKGVGEPKKALHKNMENKVAERSPHGEKGLPTGEKTVSWPLCREKIVF